MLLVSCGSGSDDGDNGTERVTDLANLQPLVFMANKDIKGTVELYVSFEAGDDIKKISGTLIAGGDVVDFRISPDGEFVAYVADQDTDQVFELYVSETDKLIGDREVKVSGTMAGNGIKKMITGKYAFAWASDNSRIAYLADQRAAGVIELFSVLPEGTSNIRLSGDLGSDRDVVEFLWAPDARRIVYLANQDFVNALELYSVLPNVAGSSQKITSGFDPGENVVDFAWAPSSQRVAFIADKNTPGLFQLWTTSPTNANNVLVSSVTPVGDGNVIEFAWAPVIGTNRIAYLADENIDEMFELFTTRGTDPVINLISLLQVDGGDVTEFAWAPDTLRSRELQIAYIADQEINDVFELFVSNETGSFNVKASGDLVTGGDVFTFQWEPGSTLIVYNADEDTDNVVELFTTPAPPSANPGVKVSGTMVVFGVEDNFQWADDSSRIAYLADQDEINVIELYTSSPLGSKNDQASGDLVLGGSVAAFKWDPDSEGLGYIADQDTFGVDELYISSPRGDKNAKVSGELVAGGSVSRFEWVP
jgi:dipeptidyl aminopeptidase/acylaminoacyl peptidase